METEYTVCIWIQINELRKQKVNIKYTGSKNTVLKFSTVHKNIVCVHTELGSKY